MNRAKNIAHLVFCMAAILLLCGLHLEAQSVSISPVPRQQFFTSSGQPLSGGQIYTYISGTSTPATTYADYTGLYPNTNPIVLDSGGMSQIWLGSGITYRFVAFDQFGTQQWGVDGLTGSPNLLSPGPIGTTTPNIVESTEFLTATAIPALSGIMRLASTDQICWRNAANSGDLCINKLVADALAFGTHPFAYLDGATFTGAVTFSGAMNAAGGGIFSGTFSGAPAISGNWSFSGIPTFSSGFKVGGSGTLTGAQGTDANVQTAGTNSGVLGAPLCNDANSSATTTGCTTGYNGQNPLFGSASPMIGSCGSGSPTVTGNNNSFVFVPAVLVTSCQIIFGSPIFTSAPACTATIDQSSTPGDLTIADFTSTSGVTFYFSSISNATIQAHCF